MLGSREPLCFLAKTEVRSWPMISAIARTHGTVFLDRRRRRDIPLVNRLMAERLSGGRSVLLFPEGTTNDGTRRGRFLTSHLACLRDRMTAEPSLDHCVVQAAILTYSDASAAWVGDATLLPHVWSVLAGTPITCTLAYGEVRRIVRGFDRKRLGAGLAAEVEEILRDTDTPRRTVQASERQLGTDDRERAGQHRTQHAIRHIGGELAADGDAGQRADQQ